MKKIKIGTRGSRLAIAQTKIAVRAIRAEYHDTECEIIVIKTTGDKRLNVPVAEFGGKGAFVDEFEKALANHTIDLAVHSAKDMPADLAGGLEICGALKRADPRDVLVTLKKALKRPGTGGEGLVIGTGSLRRQKQLKEIMPNIECVPMRGNVDSRIRRLKECELDGLVLAAAGLKRLGFNDDRELHLRYFSAQEMVPAAGQGIIAIEGRIGDAVSKMVRNISDNAAETALFEERKAMKLLGANCHEAVGAYYNGNKLLIYKGD